MSQTDEFIKEFSKDPEFKKEFNHAVARTEAAHAVRSLRDSLHLSQLDFADLVGKPQSTISRIETGQMNPSMELLSEIGRKANKDLTISYT